MSVDTVQMKLVEHLIAIHGPSAAVPGVHLPCRDTMDWVNVNM